MPTRSAPGAPPAWDLTHAAARIYPNAATRDDLLKIANFFAPGFLFDDQADYRTPLVNPS